MESIVKFLLDGKIHEINFNERITPTTTLLNYLRKLPDHRGVKEGCAEGDCGACTVIIGDLEKDKIGYRAVNSCLIFLPMLHGKLLITIENLKSPDGKLHPIQQAIVDRFGSQCGFCTPGIIMSMFDLYKNYSSPSLAEIKDVLVGNLCRCTGYHPIVVAAIETCKNGGKDHITNEESNFIKLLKSIPKQSLKIKTGEQTYFRPITLKEALQLKQEFPNAILLTGATDVALKVTKEHKILNQIIDLSAIDELKISIDSDNELRIGSGVVINDVRKLVKKDFEALYEMLNVFASNQIRNFATLGGNLGTASPIGDTLPVLMAYDGKVELTSLNGNRIISINEFFIGYRKTHCKDNEIISSVILPKNSNGSIIKSYKLSKRTDVDISTLSAGFKVDIKNNIVNSIVLAYGGMAERPKRATETENFLIGRSWNRENVEQAMLLIEKDFSPISDVRGSAEYRKVAAKNLLLKFWIDTSVMK